MLLNIYLGSVAISSATCLLSSFAISNKLKREGYCKVKQHKSFSEKVLEYTRVIAFLLLPIYNVLNAAVLIFSPDYSYEVVKKRSIEKNLIKKIEDDNIIVEVIDKEFDPEQKNIIKEYRNFNDLSREEKLAFLNSEREKLYQEKNSEIVKKKTLINIENNRF